MASEVQREIDALSARLGRSVVMNDAEIHLLYASPHYGDEDEVRVRAALYRDAGSAAIAHLLRQGITSWQRLGRIPAAPEIGLLERVCVPVRWHGELLGFVVVIDHDESLTSHELQLIQELTDHIAGLIASERHRSDRERIETESLVAGWLSDDPTRRQESLSALVAAGRIGGSARVRVVVVEMERGSISVDAARADLVLRHALALREPLLRGSALLTVVEGRGLVALTSIGSIDDAAATSIAEHAIADIDAFVDKQLSVRAGLGATINSIDRAWISRRQAELAARAARYVSNTRVANWNQLGPLGALVRIPPAELDETIVPTSVRRLVEADPAGRLTATLEVYLRHGGAGAAAAAELHIHRTSLYYRLDKIRAVTGLDLDDGDARFELKLGLLLHRMLQARSSELDGRP